MTALWYIINPSDSITFRAADIRTAEIVTTALGGGAYAATEVGEDGTESHRSVPMYLIGGKELRCKWWKENGDGLNEEQFFKQNKAEIAEAFLSVAVASPGDSRTVYESGLLNAEDKEKFKAEWNDKRRTSMNDIMGRAQQIGKNLSQPEKVDA